ncbi:MAG: biotin synthase BioB [Betaproteobacteria bacterium]|nr:biotin synthase BioB [Betaproteobacteria bacterium]
MDSIIDNERACRDADTRRSGKRWTVEEVEALFALPFNDLVFRAQTVHRGHFDPNAVQLSTLLSIKTGGCSEDCGYCPQSARYPTGVKRQGLMELEDVLSIAREAKSKGATRLCMGAAWREVKDNGQFDQVLAMVSAVNLEGLEVCCTLGMLTEDQARKLKEAGLYAYNHNIDTSEDYYKKIISTRTYEDRLRTLANVRKADLTVCCGGILGMGEDDEDRIKMLLTLSHLNPHPESVPINTLVAVEGTPLAQQQELAIWDLVRMIATTRIVLPRSYVRLSAGRVGRSIQDQALCFMAGANSVFVGEKLLTTPNNDTDEDWKMFSLLGLKPQEKGPLHAETHAIHA